MNDRQARELVAVRSGGFCEIRIRRPAVCLGLSNSKHHRRKQGQGGADVPSNMLDACGDGTRGCHGWVEANPDKARALGLWLFGGSHSLVTPVFMTFRGFTDWFMLDDEGSAQWLSPTALSRIRST